MAQLIERRLPPNGRQSSCRDCPVDRRVIAVHHPAWIDTMRRDAISMRVAINAAETGSVVMTSQTERAAMLGIAQKTGGVGASVDTVSVV